MREKIKSVLKNNLFVLRPVGKIISKISKWQYSKFMPQRILGKLLSLPIYLFLRDDYYKFLIFIQQLDSQPISKSSTRILPHSFFLRAITGDKTLSAEIYSEVLNATDFTIGEQLEWARRFMEIGRLDLARVGFQDLIEKKYHKLLAEQQLNTLRLLGAVCFMMGKNNDAHDYWRMAGQLRRALYKPSTPKGYRILGPSWFAAIGHVAMLDYYLKYKKLHGGKQRIVAQWKVKGMHGEELFLKFIKIGITLINPGDLEKDYNKWARTNSAPKWMQLSADEKAALIDDFWEYDFPDGEILGYAHAAARIQKEWEAAQYPPLFSLSEIEKNWLDDYLVNLGVPRDAWYVCLHVREAGFHKQWNSSYPSMRDAEITDYLDAIEKIVSAGGWVIRMGDPSMKPLPPMRNVIDYAHSIFKTAAADIMLAAGCRFFLGTNSGFATVSVIYGVPCALTNWVPIGWPLWPHQNLMIPKLFREKKSGRYLTLKEIFSHDLAFIQNWSSLPADIELVANTSDEITQLTSEMLIYSNTHQDEVSLNFGASLAIQNHYINVAKDYGAFTGSQLAKTFTEKYIDVFASPEEIESTEISKGNLLTWHAQSNDNTMVTLN